MRVILIMISTIISTMMYVQLLSTPTVDFITVVLSLALATTRAIYFLKSRPIVAATYQDVYKYCMAHTSLYNACLYVAIILYQLHPNTFTIIRGYRIRKDTVNVMSFANMGTDYVCRHFWIKTHDGNVIDPCTDIMRTLPEFETSEFILSESFPEGCQFTSRNSNNQWGIDVHYFLLHYLPVEPEMLFEDGDLIGLLSFLPSKSFY